MITSLTTHHTLTCKIHDENEALPQMIFTVTNNPIMHLVDRRVSTAGDVCLEIVVLAVLLSPRKGE